MTSQSNETAIDAVFVYGTLKQGQCRAGLWPCRPVQIQSAWVRGQLYGRSDYPALTAGQDRVRGELWRFQPKAIPEVLATLDEIEGTNQPGEVDLYHRITLDVFDLDDRPLGQAYAYRYATDPQRDGFQRIAAGAAGVSWPE